MLLLYYCSNSSGSLSSVFATPATPQSVSQSAKRRSFLPTPGRSTRSSSAARCDQGCREYNLILSSDRFFMSFFFLSKCNNLIYLSFEVAWNLCRFNDDSRCKSVMKWLLCIVIENIVMYCFWKHCYVYPSEFVCSLWKPFYCNPCSLQICLLMTNSAVGNFLNLSHSVY